MARKRKKHQPFLTLWTISKEKVEKPTKAFAYKCVSVCVCVGKCCPRRSSSDFVSRGHTYTHTELNILYPPFACTAYLNHKFILTPYYLSALVKVVSLFFSGSKWRGEVSRGEEVSDKKKLTALRVTTCFTFPFQDMVLLTLLNSSFMFIITGINLMLAQITNIT